MTTMASRKKPKPEPAPAPAIPGRDDLVVTYRDPKALVAYGRNARTHSAEQIEQIKASIAEFGFTNPILLKDDGETIGAGHARQRAALALGLARVPTITLPGLTADQWRAYVIADNKLALNAGWDEATLRLEMVELQSTGFDLNLTGFANAELQGIILPDQGEPQGGTGLYSGKLATPTYVPRGEAPPVSALFDDAKTKELKQAILAAELPADIAAFLLKAADRHTVFHFQRIADFYAHAPAATQRLFEASALVIIDFDSAIENGFVQLHKAIGAMALKDESEIDAD